jgi:hypothetical protein
MGFISALVLTEVIRRVALTRGVLDIPTSRSAHTVPQPRGGGAAVVAAVPLASGIALIAGASVDRRYWYCVGLATLVALVGLVDDVRALDYRPRLVAQIAAAAALIMLVGPSETIVIPGFVTPLRIVVPEPLAMALTLVAIVGFTNAFNFMDGIDGLAATVAALGGLFIGAMQMPASALVAVATTGATIGFSGPQSATPPGSSSVMSGPSISGSCWRRSPLPASGSWEFRRHSSPSYFSRSQWTPPSPWCGDCVVVNGGISLIRTTSTSGLWPTAGLMRRRPHCMPFSRPFLVSSS